MRDLKNVSNGDLIIATLTWRRHAESINQNKSSHKLMGFLWPEVNMSIYDRVDELTGEVIRLREKLNLLDKSVPIVPNN